MMGTFLSQVVTLRLRPDMYKVAFEINCKFHQDPIVILASAQQTVHNRSLGTHRHKLVRCRAARRES